MSLIDANRRSTGLIICPAAVAADDDDNDDDDDDDAIGVWSVSSKSRMPHSTSDVDVIPFPSFRPTNSTLLTSLFATGSKLSSRPFRSLRPL